MITRLADALPLLQSTEPIPLPNAEDIRGQASAIVKRLDSRSAARLTLDAGRQLHNYIIEDGIVFLVVTESAYPKRLTFSFLASLHKEFTGYLRTQDGEGWRSRLDTQGTAYAYLGFSRVLTNLRKEYADPASRSNAARLKEELSDVQSIMRANITEVLDRGERLDRACGGRLSPAARGRPAPPFHARRWPPSNFLLLPHHPISPADVSKVSSRLVSDSKKFKWSAKKLNLLDQFKQWLPCAAATLCVLLVLLWKFYF
jgi:vesicle transport protein SEC22